MTNPHERTPVPVTDTLRPTDQITTIDQARAAGEAALMAPSTFRTEWADGSTNFTITEPGATFSARFLREDLDRNATCLVVQTKTKNPDGSVKTGFYATDFSAAVALPEYDERKDSFGTVGQRVQAWRAGRHPVPIDKDLVVGQPLFGKPGHAEVTAVVMPEAAMAYPTSVFDRIRYDDADGLVVRRVPMERRTMPARQIAAPNPANSAFGHLDRIKKHYEALERNTIKHQGRTAISGS